MRASKLSVSQAEQQLLSQSVQNTLYVLFSRVQVSLVFLCGAAAQIDTTFPFVAAKCHQPFCDSKSEEDMHSATTWSSTCRTDFHTKWSQCNLYVNSLGVIACLGQLLFTQHPLGAQTLMQEIQVQEPARL
jgi:hypothetical protein